MCACMHVAVCKHVSMHAWTCLHVHVHVHLPLGVCAGACMLPCMCFAVVGLGECSFFPYFFLTVVGGGQGANLSIHP